MILRRLCSDSDLFDEIVFRDGLNIILGKYTTEGKDINGIGKTTIVDLIDLCLLAEQPKQTFRKDKYKFLKSHSVTLDIFIDNKSMSLTKHFNNLNTVYIRESSGVEKEYSDADYRIILGKMVLDAAEYSGVSDPQWYRTIMNFFIQNDHTFFQRDSRDVTKFINFGLRKSELLTFVFFLLGCDNKEIYEFDLLQVKQKQIQADQKRIKTHVKNITGKEIQDFKAEVDSLNAEIANFEKQANSYEFIGINHELNVIFEKIQQEIQGQQRRYFEIEHKLNEIRKSLSFGVDVDVNRVKNLYDELNRDFSLFLKRTVDEVQNFRNQIIQNRKKFLLEREVQYNSELESIRLNIVNLEERKKKYYDQLQQQKVLDDLKAAYSFLGDIKTKNEQNRVFIVELDRIEREASIDKNQISNVINNMVLNKPSLDEVMKRIKAIFFDIVNNSVEVSENDLLTHITIEPRANVKSPINVDIQVPRSGSLGKDRFKILAFDMTIFLGIFENNRTLPHFLIHDGVFHGIAHKTRIKYLNYVNDKFNGLQNAQYIVTLNEDEISLPPDYSDELSHINFDIEKCIIKIVEDNPKKMFFKREF
jgi:uncharacterized protein YydD (DUF2326 family)